MPKQTIDIAITDFRVEESEKGFELIYIPNQTQTLFAGQPYKFVFDIDKKIPEEVK